MDSKISQLAAVSAPDAELGTRLADFDALYDKHAEFVWRTVRSLGVSHGDVDDVVQEVFLTVYRKLDTFEGRSSLKTWLCGIAVGVARNNLRKRQRQTNATRSVVAPAQSTPSTRTEALDLVNRCLDDLDESLRLVFVLAELERLSAPEISETIGVNVNTVYSRLRIARERFEASLARHGGER